MIILIHLEKRRMTKELKHNSMTNEWNLTTKTFSNSRKEQLVFTLTKLLLTSWPPWDSQKRLLRRPCTWLKHQGVPYRLVLTGYHPTVMTQILMMSWELWGSQSPLKRRIKILELLNWNKGFKKSWIRNKKMRKINYNPTWITATERTIIWIR